MIPHAEFDSAAIVEEMLNTCAPAQSYKVRHLKGDASARRIFRVELTDGGACIAVAGPNHEENRAFVGFTRTFRRLELPVPELLHVHPDERGYLLEDLGDTTLFQWLTRRREEYSGEFPEKDARKLYRQAVEHLVAFQLRAADEIDYNLCYQTREFGPEAWRFDWDYFVDCFLGEFYTGTPPLGELEKEYTTLASQLNAAPRDAFLYRDFQSRNIMVTDGGLRFIDYQSGRRGAVSYDIASLLLDARADLPFAFRDSMLEYHADLVATQTGQSFDLLLAAFPPYALMRTLQALGAYGNLGIRKGKTEHLRSVPYGLLNALHLLRDDTNLARLPVLTRVLEEIQGKPRTGY